MSRITEEMDRQAKQREFDALEARRQAGNPDMDRIDDSKQADAQQVDEPADHALYTYWSAGVPQCHIYGPATQAACEVERDKLVAQFTSVVGSTYTIMVLPLEAMPS